MTNKGGKRTGNKDVYDSESSESSHVSVTSKSSESSEMQTMMRVFLESQNRADRIRREEREENERIRKESRDEAVRAKREAEAVRKEEREENERRRKEEREAARLEKTEAEELRRELKREEDEKRSTEKAKEQEERDRRREEETRMQLELAQKQFEMQQKLIQLQVNMHESVSKDQRVDRESMKMVDRAVQSITPWKVGEDLEQFLVTAESKLRSGKVKEEDWSQYISSKLHGSTAQVWQEAARVEDDYQLVRQRVLKACGHTPKMAAEVFYGFRCDQAQGLTGDQLYNKGTQLYRRMIAGATDPKQVEFQTIKGWL